MFKLITILVTTLCLSPSALAQTERLPNPNRLRPPVEGCPICNLWLEYEDVFLRAKQEVGRLDHGVFYFHHSEDPDIIEPLIRFANERARLARELASDPTLQVRLGRTCGHDRTLAGGMEIEISTSARGALAIIRTTDPDALGDIRRDAERATLGRVPAWY